MESAYSTTEKGTVDMSLERTAWTTFDPAPWGGVQAPDAAEKGIHQKEAQAYDLTSIKSVRGQPFRWI